MEHLFLCIISFCIGLISSIDIDFKGHTGIYNLTSGETYNFYAPVEQLAQIYIDFVFKNFTYLPFNCVYINEYSSRNGTSLLKYQIKNIIYYESQKYYDYYLYFNLEYFSTTYISFSFKSNSTIDNMKIEFHLYGGLYNLSNGVIKCFEDVYYDTPYYFVIPTLCNTKIKVELNTTLEEDLENLELVLFEYQKNNSDYYIYESQHYTNYTIDEIIDDYGYTISFNYLLKNKNTNFFCIKFLSIDHDISFLNVALREDRYYFTLYDKKSLDIFDLKPNQTYHLYLEAKMNQLINLNYSIFKRDLNNTLLPLKSMIISEDIEEFSSEHLFQFNHYIKTLSESFLYPVSEPNIKYLSLNITPLFQIEKFNIAYNMTKEIKSSFNLENNTLFNLPELYPYIRYNLSIKSKVLYVLEYEITIKNTNISSQPFQYIYFNEYPSKDSHIETLFFKKVGNDIKASSFFRIINSNTEYSTFLIKSYEYVKLSSFKVKVTGRQYYNLTKELKTNIGLLLSKQDYYFAIEVDNNIKKVIELNMTFKLNANYYYFSSINYYRESKTKFKLDCPFFTSTSFHKNGDEFIGSFEFDFTNSYDKFEILLLRIESPENLDDFRIVYNYVDKKPIEKKSENKTLFYLLIPAIIIFVIGIIATIVRYCNKKKVNSNLIEGNIETKATLLPKEEDKEQK